MAAKRRLEKRTTTKLCQSEFELILVDNQSRVFVFVILGWLGCFRHFHFCAVLLSREQLLREKPSVLPRRRVLAASLSNGHISSSIAFINCQAQLSLRPQGKPLPCNVVMLLVGSRQGVDVSPVWYEQVLLVSPQEKRAQVVEHLKGLKYNGKLCLEL